LRRLAPAAGRRVQFDAEMLKVPRDFFLSKNTAGIAKQLLGKLLVVPTRSGKRVSGMIVEVEAYFGFADKAAHSYGGRRTNRNDVMYGEGGCVYVFFVYGMYYQLNFVCGPVGHPHAILIRGIEPVEGVEIMRRRRRPGTKNSQQRSRDADDLRYLTSGPGKLSIAFGIDRSYNGEDLQGKRIWVEDHKNFSRREIAAGKRIGIDYSEEYAEKPWRFWVKENQFVSKMQKPAR